MPIPGWDIYRHALCLYCHHEENQHNPEGRCESCSRLSGSCPGFEPRLSRPCLAYELSTRRLTTGECENAIRHFMRPVNSIWADMINYGADILSGGGVTQEMLREWFTAKHSRMVWSWSHNTYDMCRYYRRHHPELFGDPPRRRPNSAE